MKPDPSVLLLAERPRRPWLPAGFSDSSAWDYLLLAPAALLLALVTFYPIVYGAGLSFFSVQLNKPWKGRPFAGLDNYLALAQDPTFAQALGNTVVWTLGTVGGQFLLGLLTAVLLNRPLPGARVFSVLVLLPWVMPVVV